MSPEARGEPPAEQSPELLAAPRPSLSSVWELDAADKRGTFRLLPHGLNHFPGPIQQPAEHKTRQPGRKQLGRYRSTAGLGRGKVPVQVQGQGLGKPVRR